MTEIQDNSVAVIGAGITGITTAYKLMKRGFAVTVFDPNSYAAMETSYANGGQLSASNAEVWNSWSTVLKGIKWMLKPGAPLLVNPKPSWHKFSWMAEFLAAIPKHEENTVTTARLAIAARQHLIDMAESEGIEFNREDRGILHFYKTPKDFEAAQRVTAMLAKGGLVRREVTPEEIRTIEPTLKGDFVGGFFTDSDFTGDIHKYTNGLAAACARQGVVLKFGTAVLDTKADAEGVTLHARRGNSGIETHRFGKVVVCAGTASRKLASQLGDRVNIYPVKGYSITVNLTTEADQAAAPWVSLLDDDAKIVASRLGADRFRVAGTAEFNGFNKDICKARIDPLVEWCNRYFPEMSTRQFVPWAGLRPMMPNMMPRVAQGRNPNVFYNTGHGHLGWTLSAITADMVSSLVGAAQEQSGTKIFAPASKELAA
ncbi:D-amino acid dehydrogenase [Rhizobium sp. L1K21]|uniref:D-amino acid dehydrogenase n=1 Tax=Rhizobium sp. L1K21 TaxID=2954933 RepID=UPI0020928CF0|nr:D-amino acid dehydrogenase [Rhizobium sp. L1K21]MCO6187235.1 D-amino acid dehydrogenase [Rhizobium sp. L1K21]